MTAESTPVPPLTRNGYTRTSKAEADILALRELPARALVRAFETKDENDPSYRCPEALVFFIRRAVLQGDRAIVDALFSVLLRRCQPFFRTAVRGLDEDARADVQAEVISDMVRLLTAKDDGGDFLQTRFWLYLRRKTVTARSDWMRRRQRMPLVGDLAGD